MKRAAAVLAIAVLASTASAQDGKDAKKGIGPKDKAPVVASKMLAEFQKRKSAAVTESHWFGEMIEAAGDPAATFDGVLRKDFSAVKGSAEVYARGTQYLVNTGARFDPPEDLEGPEGATAMTYRNPSLFFADLGKIAGSAQFGGEAVVEGKACVQIDFLADAALVKQYLKEIVSRFETRMKGANNGGFGGLVGGRNSLINIANAINEKETVATLHAWVGKDDLSCYKLEFVIRPKMKPGALPERVRIPPLDQKTVLKFGKWDEDVPFDVAAYVKNKWAIR